MKKNIMLHIGDFHSEEIWESVLDDLGIPFGFTINSVGIAEDITTPAQICITVSAIDVY